MTSDAGLLGTAVLDAHGVEAGRVSALLVTPGHHDARWLDVERADGAHVVVPVDAASADASGRLVLAYPDDVVAAAPRMSGPVLTAEEAQQLLAYYGFPPEPDPLQ